MRLLGISGVWLVAKESWFLVEFAHNPLNDDIQNPISLKMRGLVCQAVTPDETSHVGISRPPSSIFPLCFSKPITSDNVSVPPIVYRMLVILIKTAALGR